MARTYAKVYVSIWAGDFRDLSIGAQGLYFRLMTDPKLSMCGVVDWRPKRLVQSFNGMTLPALRALVRELEDSHYIVTDEDTEEALIRSFVRHDGVLKSPNLTKAMASDWLAVTSQKIKNAVVLEVRRALDEEPTLKGSDSVPDWFQISSADEISEGFRIGSDGVLVGFPYPATSNQQPSSFVRPVAVAPAPTKAPAKNRKKPVHDMPEDWAPSTAARTYADTSGLDVEWQAEQFTNHHLAKGSQFADWDRAFRTWLGNSAKWAKPADKRRPADDSWDHLKRDPDADVD